MAAFKFGASKSNLVITDTALNITEEELLDFVDILKKYNRQHSNATRFGHRPVDECANYCKGDFYQLLGVYNSIHGYVALLICLFGAIANILNIMVLTEKDMAKAPINKILKWLAVADICVIIEYIPFASYQYIYTKQDEMDFSFSWAVYIYLHMQFTLILHTISISLTVTLAVWRYVAIRHPNGACAIYLQSHCKESIIFSFVISPLLCLPTFFVFKVRERMVQDSDVPLYYVDAVRDSQLYRINFWIHSVIIKLLPCCILTIISIVLVNVLWEASNRKQKLREYSNPKRCLQHQRLQKNSVRSLKWDRRTDRTTTLLVAVLLLFLLTEFPQGILGLLSAIMEKCFFKACYHVFGELMDLLALINASFDFVLYGLMSKQFRTTFKALFFKRPLGNIEMSRMTPLTTSRV